MNLMDRLAERIAHVGISQSQLARSAHISQGAIGHLLSGRSSGSKHLPAIARELGTTVEYLLGETNDPSAGALPTPTAASVAEQLDSVLVPYFYTLDHSMGGGAYFDETPAHEMIPFKKEWLRGRISGSVDKLMMIPGRGDSMKPTIDDGDVLLVDRGQQVISEPDMIWAFGFAEAGYIKRLRRLPKGRVLVQSDNPVVRDWEAPGAEVHIVGRVVSILRWQ